MQEKIIGPPGEAANHRGTAGRKRSPHLSVCLCDGRPERMAAAVGALAALWRDEIVR
jgi:hypothetical protein